MDSSVQTLRLPLIKRNDRPSFEYDQNIFLLDTGANMPVWCSGVELFLTAYPKATRTDYVAHISGFGSKKEDEYTEADVYMLPEFIIKDDGIQFSINNLFVAVTDYEKIHFDFVLSSTMFSKTDYTIQNSENTLFIQCKAESYQCTPIVSGEVFNKISVWTQ